MFKKIIFAFSTIRLKSHSPDSDHRLLPLEQIQRILVIIEAADARVSKGGCLQTSKQETSPRWDSDP